MTDTQMWAHFDAITAAFWDVNDVTHAAIERYKRDIAELYAQYEEEKSE